MGDGYQVGHLWFALDTVMYESLNPSCETNNTLYINLMEFKLKLGTKIKTNSLICS